MEAGAFKALFDFARDGGLAGGLSICVGVLLYLLITERIRADKRVADMNTSLTSVNEALKQVQIVVSNGNMLLDLLVRGRK